MKKLYAAKREAKTIDTTDRSFIRIFIDGPAVSLNGSPTVSPTTVALWFLLFFPPKFPDSICFFALSHAPPAFAISIASKNPDIVAPMSIPEIPSGPSVKPITIGDTIPSNDGPIIFLREAFVQISMHFA